MKKAFFYEENCGIVLNDDNILGEGHESTVYRVDGSDFVLKVFRPQYRNRKIEKRITSLSKYEELRDYLTIPFASAYLDFRFIGYLMENSGNNLKDLVLDDKINDDELVDILKRIKNILVCLKDTDFVHGDLQLKNILVNDESVKLGDINNSMFGKYKAFLNVMTRDLARYYGENHMLDLLSFNYLTYLLLNLPKEERKEYLLLEAYGLFHLRNDIIINNVFEDEVFEEQMDLLIKPKVDKKLCLRDDKYLIDYLK